MNATASMALKLIPENLRAQPVFLCIDDTIVPKYGKKFEDASKLFDHSAHHGSGYLNGHCFVSVMLCVPVWDKDRIVYQALPLSYRMWQKKSPSWNLPLPWYGRSCLSWRKRKMSSSCVTAGTQKGIWFLSWMNTKTLA